MRDRKREQDSLSIPDTFYHTMCTSIEDIPKLVKVTILVFQQCASSNREVASEDIFYLRHHLCTNKELFLGRLLKLSIVDILASNLVNVETDYVKCDAAWVLTFISSGDSQHTTFFLKESVISALSSLLSVSNPLLVEQSIWTLSNIIGDGPVAREFVLRSNILSLLDQPLKQHFSSIPVMKSLTRMIFNICKRMDMDIAIEYVPKIIPILDVLIIHKDEGIIGDVLISISYLTKSSSDHVSMIIDSGIINKVYKFLDISPELTINTMGVLINIAVSESEHTQYLQIMKSMLICIRYSLQQTMR
ncbi:Importin subunit alpha-3 [Thelohanellus kitauei]|uniref:Importin subunit alpha-3 n=1 Tax=Thelohanellus kitauei TaxID=669202 RepID=A0A0C2JG59_THEKT|nr:Importin subunit alpha-3 [Thelohanellus kitauei]